jgi:hypothetical protein
MTVFALTQSGSTVCYQSPMRLRCYRLEYPRPDNKSEEAKLDHKAD